MVDTLVRARYGESSLREVIVKIANWLYSKGKRGRFKEVPTLVNYTEMYPVVFSRSVSAQHISTLEKVKNDQW